ncbi:hypothetical protein GLP24_01660 [Photobacterium carnosum]|uniref:hypothetical protein n=1 Tax=Photobacterium carnosum TaxID=2023717 RepID=UPI001E3AA89D|nr:hypothetical protein [Photobacterium carnosum]MCD9543566.1 hypothetical protein [Photobacterium carnosum]
MALLDVITKMKYLIVFILLSVSSTVFGLTNAGTKIMNQAIMTYFDSTTGENIRVLSNISHIKVEKVYDVSLSPDTSGDNKTEKNVSPGSIVSIPHTVTNTGNIKDSYIINVNNLTDDNGDLTSPSADNIKIYFDTNGNGIHDPGEPELNKNSDGEYISGQLKPGESINIVYTVELPTTDKNNDFYDIDTVVTSINEPSVEKTSSTKLTVINGPIVNLTIENSPICQQQVTSLSEIDFRVNYTSVGRTKPESAALPYNIFVQSETAGSQVKVSHTGVLISVKLPANISLLQDKVINGQPAKDHSPITLVSPEYNFDGGVVLVGINNNFIFEQDDHNLDWYEYSSWDGLGNVEKVGFLVKPDYMKPNTSGHFSYYAQVNDVRGTVPFKIYSEAEVNLSSTAENISRSGEACNTLVGKEDDNLIDFELIDNNVLDPNSAFTILYSNHEHFIPTNFYYHSSSAGFDSKFDGVHAQIILPQGNEHASTIDIIGPKSSNYPVTLRSSEGDSFYWIFAETGPNTGIFRSVIPVHAVSPKDNYIRPGGNHCLDDISIPWRTGEISRTALLSNIDNTINFKGFDLNGSTADDCEIQSNPNDELVIEVFDPNNNNRIILTDLAYISPQFVVFDATNFNGVENAIVKFYQTENNVAPTAKVRVPNVDGLVPVAEVISDVDGRVLFPKLAPINGNQYYISVEPPQTHVWPSAYTTLANFNIYNVTPMSYGPYGNDDIENSGLFPITVRDRVDTFDIPLDPKSLDRRLTIQKDADKDNAEIGSFVKYSVTIKNNLPDSQLFDAQVFDSMPYGFKYMEGSTRLNDQPYKDPVRIDTYTYRFDIGTLSGSTQPPENGSYKLTYVLQLTAGAIDSDGINSVYVNAATFGGTTDSRLTSNIDKYQVKVTQTGVMSDRGIIFGKVFVDAQCNDIMKNQMWPIGGVKIYLETGDYVITDENGQYSMFGVKAGNHVMKVDKQTLPLGIELEPTDTRNAGKGDSRFVDMRRGEMHRADFVAPCPVENQEAVYQELKERNTNINGEWLFKTAENFKGLQYDAKPKALKADELQAGVISGPSTAADNASQTSASTSSLTVFKGYALESRKGSNEDLASMITLYPKSVQDEAYIYPSTDKLSSIRFGFSDSQEKLNDLRTALSLYKIKTEIVPTAYNNIPKEAKFRIDNILQDVIPLPESEAKNITRAEAESGAWYWPTNDYSYDGRFIAVIRGDVEPTLYVNGQVISIDQLGERIINKRENAQIVGWYGVPLEDGDNVVEIKTIDPFGNERLVLGKTFSHPKSAKRISVVADGDVLRADGGRSVIPVIIKLYDENNNLARGTYFVTLNTDQGDTWLDPDIQENETGHQVRVINGEKTVYLRSTENTGQVNIQASVEDFSDKIKLYQIAAKRPLFVSGILNYTGRYGRFSGEQPPAQLDGYENKSYSHDERAAAFIKGNIKGGMHLTLSYDSDKSDEEFYREISPDSYYPIPGDASIKGYDARSTSKLYVKLEKERHFAMWGDYSTADGTDESDIGRTSQILNGFNSMYNDGKLTGQLYGARPEDLHKVVEFNGNGTAMFYSIGDTRIVRHSDTVTLVTYDRDNAGLVLSQQPLARYIDYTIDYFTGDMRFNRVIPTYDANLNPIKVRVAYDVDGDGDAYTVAGARLSYLFTPYLISGISYEYNDNDVEGYDIGSLWVNYDFDSKTQVTASVATMSHKGNESADTLTTATDTSNKIKDGMAYKLRINRDWNTQAATELEYVYAEEGFTNTTGGVTPARQELRLRHRQKLTGLMNLNIEASHSESLVHTEKQQTIGATVDTKILGSQWTTRLGSRYIKNETETDSEEYTTAIVGLGRTFSLWGRPGRLDTEYEQSFGHDSKRRFNVKADWKVHKQASIYTQYEYIDSLSGISNLGSGSTSLFTAGIDVDWLHGGSTFNEFRQRGASDGRSLELANGYRGRFEVIPGISVDPAIEYVEVIEGEGTSGVAVSLGLADIRNPNYKTTGRIEYRHGESEDYYGVLGAWVTRLSQDWSGLVREEYRYIDKENAQNTWSNHFSLGFAYRPRLSNRYHMLGAYEWKTERNDSTRTAHIFSTHQNYQLSPDWTISGRVGLKWEDFTEYEQDYDSVATIIDGRAIYYINRRWDVDVHGGMLGTDWFDSRRYSFGVGLNYLVMKNLRAGIGYNVIGFDDDDLDPQGYNLQGFYFEMMFKLDEDLFGWLSE